MRIFVCLVMITLLGACGSQESQKSLLDGLVDLNLLEYGLPIVIKAPEGAAVDKSSIGFFDDVTVKSGDYNLQILVSDAASLNLQKLVEEEKATVRNEAYFSSFIEESPKGFIYETKIDSLSSYDFRYLHIQADRVYKFQAGLLGNYSQLDIERLVSAVAQD
ncbi:MAG: hypothetical protein AAF598_06380 [Bacteroidota bacterium]